MPERTSNRLLGIKSVSCPSITDTPCYQLSSKLPAHLVRLRAGTLGLMLALAGATGGGFPTVLLAAESRPPLMLPNSYHPGVALSEYWVSEKYDGMRGYWDGEKLLTRGGQLINAPAWFTAGWPKTPLDGELWAGRGRFSAAVSTVRQQAPDDAAWRGMRFMVFDLPADSGVFNDRVQTLNELLAQLALPWVQPVAQTRVASQAALQVRLQQTVREGGEGLVLHRGASLYRGQRSDDLLKLKTHDDAEARVVGHIPGKGKHTGQLGALLVEMSGVDGKPPQRFKLGSGLTDAQRQNPPALDTLVTYRYRGLNDSGVPRFASFMRIRED